MSKCHRGPPLDASGIDSVHLTKRFQEICQSEN